MDGENGGAREEDAVEQGLEQQAQTSVEQQERQEQSATPEQVADGGYKAALAARNTRIAELEKQVAEAAESKAAAKKLADGIEKVRAEAAEERVAHELRLAGVRNAKAAKALFADYEGGVGKLREGEPWLFAKPTAEPSGATGLKPAGAAVNEEATLAHWREVAGLTGEEEQPPMANSIAFRKNYTAILDEVYQHASVSAALNSGGRFRQAGRSAKEIMIPKIEVTGLGDCTRNEGYKTGSIDFSYETKTFDYDRGMRLFADVMDMEEPDSRTASCSQARSCSARRSPRKPTPSASRRSHRTRASPPMARTTTRRLPRTRWPTCGPSRARWTRARPQPARASCSSRRRSKACWMITATRTSIA